MPRRPSVPRPPASPAGPPALQQTPQGPGVRVLGPRERSFCPWVFTGAKTQEHWESPVSWKSSCWGLARWIWSKALSFSTAPPPQTLGSQKAGSTANRRRQHRKEVRTLTVAGQASWTEVAGHGVGSLRGPPGRLGLLVQLGLQTRLSRVPPLPVKLDGAGLWGAEPASSWGRCEAGSWPSAQNIPPFIGNVRSNFLSF